MTSTREALQSVVARLEEVIDQLPADPPEVPETVTEWPENDEHLRGDCWKSPWGSILLYRDGKWRWWNSWDRTWPLQATPGLWTPLERIADPTEVPDTIEQWPEDDTHLRGDFWKCSWGSVISYRGDGWYWWDHRDHCWRPENHPGCGSILTRTTDPSVPRTWDTLDDVPEDVERVTGDYLRASRELARSPLVESGWFERVLDGPFRWWTELPETETRNITNIKEATNG